MLTSWQYARLAAVCAAVWAAGCGSEGPHPVVGVVTLDGQSVAGAQVIFRPDNDPRGQGAFGTTDENGRFVLKTAMGAGALTGEYRVVVRKITGPPLPSGPPPAGATPAQEEAHRRAYEAVVRQQKSELPAVYGDANDTPLRQTVPTSGEISVALESARHADKPFVHPELKWVTGR